MLEDAVKKLAVLTRGSTLLIGLPPGMGEIINQAAEEQIAREMEEYNAASVGMSVKDCRIMDALGWPAPADWPEVDITGDEDA